MRLCAVVDPPWNGWADLVLLGKAGGFLMTGDFSSGLSRAESTPSNDSGMTKGEDCCGMAKGSGGRDFGDQSVFRGASRRGSTDLRYVVKTSGKSLALSKGKSRLPHCQHRAQAISLAETLTRQ